MPSANIRGLVNRASIVRLCSTMLVACLGTPVQGQGFWSPRDVVLDTYTEPVPFPCDGDLLLAYELHITNMDPLPISLVSVEVLADGSPTPAKAYTGRGLTGSLTRIPLEGQSEVVSEVMGGQRAILHVLLSYAGNEMLPRVLTHRIRYAFLKDDGLEVGATVEGGAVRVGREREAVKIGAPLGEGIWLTARGVSQGVSGHRGGAIRPRNGIPYQKARYAIDFVGIHSTAAAFHGSPMVNEQWVGYGAEVLAVGDGRVVTVQDGLPDSRPFDPDRLKTLTGGTLGGNEIVLDIGNDLFAFYGHLQPGSIPVREGDRVRKGQVLGRLGNSGNSDAPHLHFQVNRAIPIGGEAVPYVFEDYEYLGTQELSGIFNNPERVAQVVVGGALQRLTERTKDRNAARPGGSMVDSTIASTLRNSMPRVPEAPAPDWVRTLPEGGELRRQEMPVANAVIRFRRTPRRG